MISGFIAYAEKYHRPDLARQIKKDAEQSHQLVKRTSEYIGVNVDPISPIVRSQFRRLNVSGGLFVIGVVLIGNVIINRPLQKWADREMRGEMWQIHQVKNMPAIKR